MKNVYIAGATAVVSPGIEADFRAKKYSVTRHGGNDRFSTSIQDVQATIKPSAVVLLGGVAGLSEEVAQGRPCT